MTDKILAVLVPLINPNEPESLLAELPIREGLKVNKNQVLASFETTKSTFELTAEQDGFVRGLRFKAGDTIKAGERLCYLTVSVDQLLPEEKATGIEKTAGNTDEIPANLRITRPALALARQHQLDLNSLPQGRLVTEKMITELLAPGADKDDPSALVIYGGGGHAKSLIDLIRAVGKYTIAAILDDGIPAGTRILDLTVSGGGELLPVLRRKGIYQAVNAVGGIGSITPRLAVYSRLRDAGFTCVTVIHPRAYIEPNAIISDGCQVFFNAYIGSDVRVGFGTIINTGAIISHDCTLGEYTNISPGAILAGAVLVGDRALIGMGATVNLGVRIGAGARVGNSAVVKKDVPENGIVRAGMIWPPD